MLRTALVALLVFLSTGAAADIVTRESAKSVPETVAALTDAIEGAGATVFCRC
ncbi:MAG: hypothetical protein AAFO58_05345 [Pseudomonadota bacterium]